MAKLTNTPLETTVMGLEQRKSFAFSVSLIDIHGRPFSLVGATVTFTMGQVQEPGQPPVVVLARDAVVPQDTSGSCTVSLQADELDYPAGSYPFVITLRVSGYSLVIVKGEVQLAENTEWASEAHDYVGGLLVNSGFVVEMQGLQIVQVTVQAAPPTYDSAGTLPVGTAEDWTVPTSMGDGTWQWLLPRNADWAALDGEGTEILNKPNISTVLNRTSTPRLTLSDNSEATLSSTQHGLQIGLVAEANLVADTDEIQARINGAANALNLNPHGGAINLGSSTSDVNSPARIRLTKTGDAWLTSTDHALQIGASNAPNLIFDADELMARNNGAAALLGLNADGGDIALGGVGSLITVPGTLRNIPLAIGAGGTNLNTLLGSGLYAQYANGSATLALNYPEAKAGLLEVFAAASGVVFVWQRYTVYDPTSPNVYVRTNYNGTWGAWRAVSVGTRWDTIDVQQMITTTGITATTTDAQVGQSISMDCLAGDKVLVNAVFDITAGAVTFIGKLFSNGSSAGTGEAHLAGTATSTVRGTISMDWVVDLSTTGTRAFTLRASTTTGTAVVSATHTRFTAQLLRQR